jgi:hypothetical protein
MEPSTDCNRNTRKRKRGVDEIDANTNQRQNSIIHRATDPSLTNTSNHNVRYGELYNLAVGSERITDHEIGYLSAGSVNSNLAACTGGPIGFGPSENVINQTVNEPYRNRSPLQQRNIWRRQGNTMWGQGYHLPGPNRRTIDELELPDGVWNQEPRDRTLGSESRFPRAQAGLGGQANGALSARGGGGEPINYPSVPVDRHSEAESRVYSPSNLAEWQSNLE